MKYLRLFETTAAYDTAKDNLDLPNVSYCEDNNEVHYSPWVEPPFFAKLTLNNGEVVELEGSGELTQAMVSDQYKDTLVSAEIGELCTSIGNNAFFYCTSLTSIDIPNSVTSIGNFAFYFCTGLTSITIPSGVTSIGSNVFLSCGNLFTITSHIMNAPSVHNGTFEDVKTGGTLYVPIGSSGYETWMNNQGNLGMYNWTKVEQ